MATHGRKPWTKFITPENTHLVSPEAIDLLVRRGGAGRQQQAAPRAAWLELPGRGGVMAEQDWQHRARGGACVMRSPWA